jgi:hypothetical protein
MIRDIADGTARELSSEQGQALAAHLAQGEAALMLIECLMLVLIEQKLFTAEQMSEAVETALSTKAQMVRDGEHPQISRLAAGLLRRIRSSMAAT